MLKSSLHSAAFKATRRAIPVVLGSSSRRFLRMLDNPEDSQERTRRSILQGASPSAYGRHLGITPEGSYAEFASKVPVASYEDFRPWIERQMKGEAGVLTSEPALFYERTSGSSGPTKFIPYTTSLRRSFNTMFLLWIHDLITHGPRLETGMTFLSVSPITPPPEDILHGASIGVEDDRDYLEGWVRFFLGGLFVPPATVTRLRDPENFRHVLCLHLLASEDLEIFSLWNPTYLAVLLDYMKQNWPALRRNLVAGSVVREGLAFRFPTPGPSRTRAFSTPSCPEPAVLWPRLKLVSCWESAQARHQAERLGNLFPGVLLQGKGLLATEAPMTIPLIQAKGCVPLLQEVFLEFEAEDRRICRLHELELGRDYGLIVTQHGGLLRYRIGDRVRATHRYRQTPCLEFLGRAGAVSDMVGEKLSEAFVEGVLRQLPLGNRDLCLAPESEPAPHYVLATDRPVPDQARMEERLDTLLSESYRYQQARLLGQLEPPRIAVLPDLQRRILEAVEKQGTRWGAFKSGRLLRYSLGRPLPMRMEREGSTR